MRGRGDVGELHEHPAHRRGAAAARARAYITGLYLPTSPYISPLGAARRPLEHALATLAAIARHLSLAELGGARAAPVVGAIATVCAEHLTLALTQAVTLQPEP